MRTNEERAVLIHKRTAEIKQERQKRKQHALELICVAACLTLCILLLLILRRFCK